MKRIFYTILFLTFFSISIFGHESIGLLGGNIFDGEKFVKKDSEEYKNQIEFIKQFLSKYHRSGGTVLIGSDFFNQLLTVELKAFIKVDAFNELELLRIVSGQTPQAVFPERKIGSLNEGFEGSVLVLDKDPLEDSKPFWYNAQNQAGEFDQF